MSLMPQEIMFKEAYVITQAAKKLGNTLDPVIEMVTKNVIDEKNLLITGIGKNSYIAQKLASTYSSIGIPSYYFDCYNSLHGDLGLIRQGQLMMCFSKSGKTDELIHAFDLCGKKGAILININCNPEAEINKVVNKYNGINISLECEFEADQNGVAPTTSSALFLSLGDAIGCCVSANIGFDKSKFLQNHPGGALGAMLRQQLEQ